MSETEIKKKPNTVLIVTVSILCTAILAAAGWWFFVKPTSAKAADSTAGQKVKGILHLESFVVNLADPDGNHYIRIGIEIGVDQPLEPSGKGAATGPIRDAILEVLTARHADALLMPDGKTNLKHDILRDLQQKVPEIGAREVYFTEFLIQR